MIHLKFYLLLFSLIFSLQTAEAKEKECNEQLFGSLALQIDHFTDKMKWKKAMKLGEELLICNAILNSKTNARYITFLKKINLLYEKAGTLHLIKDRVKNTYELSLKILGKNHGVTLTSLDLYYYSLIINKSYTQALIIAEEAIKGGAPRYSNNQYRQHHYLEQLASLYGVFRQFDLEEKTLIKLLKIEQKLYGENTPESLEIKLNIAQNYCRLKKIKSFKIFTEKHALKYNCLIQKTYE